MPSEWCFPCVLENKDISSFGSENSNHISLTPNSSQRATQHMSISPFDNDSSEGPSLLIRRICPS